MTAALALVVEPRSHNDILSDLLQIAIDTQWSDRANTACHCHPEYTPCCPECGVHKHTDEYTRNAQGVITGYVRNEHEPDCKRVALIEESRAFLRVENKLAEERGEEGVYVP